MSAKNKATITAEPGKQELFISREFDAPCELVYRAHTDPDLFVQWLGPRGYEMVLETFEPYSGGRWGYVHKDKAYYWCRIPPEVSHDLRAESGNLGWNIAHINTDPAVNNVWAGEIGDYEGAFFVESSRLPNAKDGADQTALATTAVTVAGTSAGFTFGVASSAVIATRAEVGDKVAGTGIASGAKITAISTSGSTTTFTVDTANTAAVTATTLVTVTPVTRVFDTLLCGQQALAEAVAEEPHNVIGNVTDKLMRFRPMGWYGVLGFARYREEALYRIESGSSIAAL